MNYSEAKTGNRSTFVGTLIACLIWESFQDLILKKLNILGNRWQINLVIHFLKKSSSFTVEMKDIFVVFRYLWLERYEKLKTYNESRELEDECPKTSTKGNTMVAFRSKWRGLLPPVIYNIGFSVKTLKSFLTLSRQLKWWQKRNNYSGYCCIEIHLIGTMKETA